MKITNQQYLRKSFFIPLCLCAIALNMMAALLPATVKADEGFANDAFAATYNAGGLGAKLWGAPVQTLNEPFRQSKGGVRPVQYFDKGRMEQSYANGSVSSGRLVLDMVTGRVQIGESQYLQYDGAEIPVAGGNTFAANPGAPSYLAFQSLLGSQLSKVGSPVTAVLNPPEDEGLFLGFLSLGQDATLGSLVTNSFYASETAHNIPDVFWKFLNQTDADGLPLFNWQSVFGLPITDSYWAKVRNGGEVSDILVQLYERRTLLYNPATGSVECGNVGQDYYRWRYQLPELPIMNDTLTPPDSSANAKVTPPIGEGGTVFRLEGSGFQPGEPINYYYRVSPDGGVYAGSGNLNADSNGKITGRLSTSPYSISAEVYYTLTGVKSGNTVLWHIKLLGSSRYTPGAEAIQPTDVPPGIKANLDRKLIPAGENSRFFAGGFQPGETISAWVTSAYNRVESAYIPTSLQKVGANGVVEGVMSAPRQALPGIYAVTFYGNKSGNTAIAYFRMRAGLATAFSPFWSIYLTATGNTTPSEAAIPWDVTNYAQNRSLYRQPQNYELEP